MTQTRARRTGALSVVVTDQAGRPGGASGLARWLETVAPPRVRGQVVIALVPDPFMRRLNRRFAGIDRVTDVLSFPAGPEVAPARPSRRPGGRVPFAGGPRPLGDIVIAAGRAERQARKAGHAFRTELRVLALHGLLHLLGHDHHTDDGAMARLERQLRRRGGLPDSLIERAAS